MARLAIYVERYTIRRAQELMALTNFKLVASQMGHTLDFLFRQDLLQIPEYDGLFIRALTDPENAAYVAARIADLHGLRVIDDPLSILICCDKVHMYRRLMEHAVPMPDTLFVSSAELGVETATRVFDTLGSPVVLKAPNSSFSMYVEKVATVGEFLAVGRRFLRRSDRIVAQRFMPSQFDWRVTTLGGEPLFAARYVMPKDRWKIQTVENGRVITCEVFAEKVTNADPALLDMALAAARAIGDGFYGVDLKEFPDGYRVIEVNDNPNLDAGEEDKANPEIYRKILAHIARGRREVRGDDVGSIDSPSPRPSPTGGEGAGRS